LFFRIVPAYFSVFVVLHNRLSFVLQDCAGVILSAAESGTQVALQVKDFEFICIYVI